MLETIPSKNRNNGYEEVESTKFPNIRTHQTRKEMYRKSIDARRQNSKSENISRKIHLHAESSLFGGSNSTLDTDVSSSSLYEDSLSTLDIDVLNVGARPSSENGLSYHDSLTKSRKSAIVRIKGTTPSAIEEIDCICDASSSNTVISSNSSLTSSVKSKAVRFCLSKNEYVPASRKVLTRTEIDRSWWSMEEYNTRIRRTKVFIAAFPLDNKKPTQALIQLVALCYKAQGHQLDDYRRAIMLAPTVSRGLESEIIPPLRQSRRRHVEAVLEVTRTVPSRDVEAIANRSRALSRPHQILAQVFAQRDAVAAGIGVPKKWRTQ